MSNVFVAQFKDTVHNFYKTNAELLNRMEENRKRFSAEYVEKENAKVTEQAAQTYETAKASINNTFNMVKELLAVASFPDVERLTADRLFFSSDDCFDLSHEEVASFIQRYRTNYTMLKLISAWITKHNEESSEAPYGKYAGIKVVLPSDMLPVYKKFAESALSLINTIYFNNGVNKNMIDSYADENFAKELYEIIGSGLELSEYRTKQVPEMVRHQFDDVVLSGAE